MAEARVERRLAAILAADVAGYSRLMGADEVGTLAALRAVQGLSRASLWVGTGLCPLQTRTPSLARPLPRVQTTVREGSPLVKLRNSA